MNDYSSVTVVAFGRKNHNCMINANATMPPSMAKSFSRFPASVDLPNQSVMNAPAKTPVIFIIP